LLGFNGRPILTAVPDHPINGRERIAQLSAHIGPAKRLEIAKAIVTARIGRGVPERIRSLSHVLMWEARRADEYGRGGSESSATIPTRAMRNVW
jgi:hypothetical protein